MQSESNAGARRKNCAKDSTFEAFLSTQIQIERGPYGSVRAATPNASATMGLSATTGTV